MVVVVVAGKREVNWRGCECALKGRRVGLYVEWQRRNGFWQEGRIPRPVSVDTVDVNVNRRERGREGGSIACSSQRAKKRLMDELRVGAAERTAPPF